MTLVINFKHNHVYSKCLWSNNCPIQHLLEAKLMALCRRWMMPLEASRGIIYNHNIFIILWGCFARNWCLYLELLITIKIMFLEQASEATNVQSNIYWTFNRWLYLGGNWCLWSNQLQLWYFYNVVRLLQS
jgi:hypothetical protein